MTTCYLCKKNNVKMSLEHSIPKFLYGIKSDDKFKKMNLCEKCNNELGKFVDGRFAHSFFVSTKLNEFKNDTLYKFTALNFDDNDSILQLIDNNQYIDAMVNEKFNVYWLKNNDKNFLCLVGGEPYLSKMKPSKLFILPTAELSENELKNILLEINKEFKKYSKLEILLCVDFVSSVEEINDSNLNLFYEKIKKIFDINKVKFIWEFTENELKIKEELEKNRINISRIVIDYNDITRFLSKLFLGILCGYLGNDFINSNIGKKLIETILTYKTKSNVKKIANQMLDNELNLNFLADINSINISIFKTANKIYGWLSISDLAFSLHICDENELSLEQKEKLNIDMQTPSYIPTGIILKLEHKKEKYSENDVAKYFFQKCLNKIPREYINLAP
ncbi:HNH endonuclease [Campylobacter sp. JMF_06 NA1]|uniref:HNH endonuclease n=1 Tax=Campylobacter sp. JMF_06 NA1 TaxID=2983823 RepID=UPI0022EA0FB2|nr:HNH endonuclease [Campylobacter sp. JMF_06 NA1]MDA3077466.1 HNH endonuclease [Campylobacter sp. JMF_06 NA1]